MLVFSFSNTTKPTFTNQKQLTNNMLNSPESCINPGCIKKYQFDFTMGLRGYVKTKISH